MVVGSKAQVFSGTADKTSGGLKKNDLMRTADGRIVSVKKHKAGKSNPALKKWRAAVDEAKEEMGLDSNSFVLIKGPLKSLAKQIYESKK